MGQAPWKIPSDPAGKVFWATTCIVQWLYFITIPSCCKDEKGQLAKTWWPIIFLSSAAWVTAWSYVMVWFATTLGTAWDIPQNLMGLTFLAIGSSVPDLVASIHLAKRGKASKAIGNVIGSTVFDVSVALSLPWLIKSLASGENIAFESEALSVIVFTLFLVVSFVLLCVKWEGTQLTGDQVDDRNKLARSMKEKNLEVPDWQLSPRLSRVLIVVYCLFVLESVLLELEIVEI